MAGWEGMVNIGWAMNLERDGRKKPGKLQLEKSRKRHLKLRAWMNRPSVHGLGVAGGGGQRGEDFPSPVWKFD